jgi:hypothetical protein
MWKEETEGEPDMGKKAARRRKELQTNACRKNAENNKSAQLTIYRR